VRRLLSLFRPWERLVLGRVRCSTGLGLTSARGFESNRFLLFCFALDFVSWAAVPLDLRLDGIIQG
jgi:hypothetical protein